MAILDKSKRLKKELTLFNIYTIATGTTIASGFFLLPGLAFAEAGPGMVLSYLLASIPVFPALLSKAELATAMPRSGGVYYFLDRSMGPLWGTVGGLGTWLALILKTAFALVGMGAYVSLFLPEVPLQPLAIGLAILFGIVNLGGARKTGIFQSVLVVGLLLILGWFLGISLSAIQPQNFQEIPNSDPGSIFSTAGLVYVSYVGLTKIASVAEEIKNPERNIPLGMFLALGTATVVYLVGTVVMVGIIPAAELSNALTPVALAAEYRVGHTGAVVLSIAAILAFFSVANAGILSASRYPLAMSRDHLFPAFLGRLSRLHIPANAIFLTVGLIVCCLLLFDPTKIAKLASAFQLLLFALVSLVVIVMRESHIPSYDPGFRSPFYPWMQIFGIVVCILLIIEMGWLPLLFTMGLLTIGAIWYFYYAREKVVRGGAIYHIFARLGELRFEGLDRELRGILKEKGLRAQDPFDSLVSQAAVIDIEGKVDFEKVVRRAAEVLSQKVAVDTGVLFDKFMQGTRIGATPVSHGAALPHLRLGDIRQAELIIVRTDSGVYVDIADEFLRKHASDNPVFAFFFLVSPEANPGLHLRILAQIAGRVDDRDFTRQWLAAETEQEIKEVLLREDHFLSLEVRDDNATARLIDRPISAIDMPEGSLISMIHRAGNVIIPRGSTVLHQGDRLTIIGYPEGIRRLKKEYLIE